VREGGRTCVFRTGTGNRTCLVASAAVRALRANGARGVSGSNGGRRRAARTSLAVEPISPQQDQRLEKVLSHTIRDPSFFSGDRTAKGHGSGAERGDDGMADGFAQALDVRGCGRRGWRVRLLSSRTLRRRCDRWLRHASPVATIAISQSRGWSQKIAKTRNDAGGLRLAELGVSDSGNGQAGPRSCVYAA